MGACFSVGLNTRNPHLVGKSTSASVPPSQTEILQAENLKSFRFNVLQEATEKFHPNNEVGEGRFSAVYKGWIDEQSRVATKPGIGTAVAVKRFDKHYRTQWDQDWLADMNYFGQLNHENLVKYIGYCLEGGHRLVVYEFMPRGSLANHLSIRGSHFQCLSWNHRIKVALGAAKGLAYLHSTQPKMINVYFKSSNILIDSDYNAKLSDFGFYKKKRIDPEFVGAANAYVAPEHLRTGRITEKCEIYSFGVVLLELLTGRRSFDKNLPSDSGQRVAEVLKPILTNKEMILRVMDPSIHGQYSYVAATRAALLANKCVMSIPRHRPNANDLVNELEQIQHL